MEYVGLDKNISNWVGVVKKLKKGLLVVKLFGKKNNSECQFRDEQGGCLFRVSCQPRPSIEEKRSDEGCQYSTRVISRSLGSTKSVTYRDGEGPEMISENVEK